MLYKGGPAPIYRITRIVIFEHHDHGYPMTVAVSSISEVAVGGFFLLPW
jgi:hypothetical protein